jgi:hypothetical protein
MKNAFVILIVALFIVAGPLLVLWSLNTLFPVLAIPYAIETWFAALILGGLVKSRVNASN